MEKATDYKGIVQLIFNKINDGENDEVIIESLQKTFQISVDTSEWAIEMVRTGYFRASFIRKGQLHPKSNLDTDPFLLQSIQIALEQLNKE